jgi:hypothetical protein
MPFQAHEHLFRTMPVTQEYDILHHRRRLGYDDLVEQHEACRHESFITFVPSASGLFYKCELCNVYMNADVEIHPHCRKNEHVDRIKQVRALQAQPTVVCSSDLGWGLEFG